MFDHEEGPRRPQVHTEIVPKMSFDLQHHESTALEGSQRVPKANHGIVRERGARSIFIMGAAMDRMEMQQ